MNNKGFAITTVLYGTFLLFIMLLVAMLGILSNYKKKIGDAVAVNGDKKFAIGGRLIPGLTYRFNDHILFTTEIGLLSINYNHTKKTSAIGIATKSDEFKLGANTRQVASFGFVYLF
jgi:hypothetical protein